MENTPENQTHKFDADVAASVTLTGQSIVRQLIHLSTMKVLDSYGVGPTFTIRKSCSACKAELSESYACQGDSGQNVYCTHESVGKKFIADTRWDTPDWCPVLSGEDAQ